MGQLDLTGTVRVLYPEKFPFVFFTPEHGPSMKVRVTCYRRTMTSYDVIRNGDPYIVIEVYYVL